MLVWIAGKWLSCWRTLYTLWHIKRTMAVIHSWFNWLTLTESGQSYWGNRTCSNRLIGAVSAASYITVVSVIVIWPLWDLGTVSMLETTSGFGEIESTEIPHPFSPQMIPHRFTSTWKVLITSDSHLRPNRKWKYGGNQKMNSRPSTSYSTSIQCIGLSGIISMLETTFGLVRIETIQL